MCNKFNTQAHKLAFYKHSHLPGKKEKSRQCPTLSIRDRVSRVYYCRTYSCVIYEFELENWLYQIQPQLHFSPLPCKSLLCRPTSSIFDQGTTTTFRGKLFESIYDQLASGALPLFYLFFTTELSRLRSAACRFVCVIDRDNCPVSVSARVCSSGEEVGAPEPLH